MNNSDMPAMPLSGDAYGDINGTAMTKGSIEPGMGLTKREAFTIEIFKAIIIGNNADFICLGIGAAKDAIQAADILLNELDNEQI